MLQYDEFGSKHQPQVKEHSVAFATTAALEHEAAKTSSNVMAFAKFAKANFSAFSRSYDEPLAIWLPTPGGISVPAIAKIP